MFERYTEKARRVIFFARYEASEYGSPCIETEHLLLGLLREDQALLRMFLGQGDIQAEIRGEVERHIARRERISTSVEIPLTDDCRKALSLAAKESERLGQRHVGSEHVLLGMLGVERSVAANLLRARGFKAADVRVQLSKSSRPSGDSIDVQGDGSAKLTLDSFFAGLKWHKTEELVEFFAENAQFIDVFGKRSNREEILKSFETLFAPYAKKNAVPLVEETVAHGSGLFVVSVLWKNAILASLQRVWTHRMSVVLIMENEGWRILLMHVTPVQPL